MRPRAAQVQPWRQRTSILRYLHGRSRPLELALKHALYLPSLHLLHTSHTTYSARLPGGIVEEAGTGTGSAQCGRTARQLHEEDEILSMIAYSYGMKVL